MKKEKYKDIAVAKEIQFQLLKSKKEVVDIVKKEQEVFLNLFPVIGKIYGNNPRGVKRLESSYNAIMNEFKQIIYINQQLLLDESQYEILYDKSLNTPTTDKLKNMLTQYEEASSKQLEMSRNISKLIHIFKEDLINYKEHLHVEKSKGDIKLKDIQYLEQAISHLDKLTDDLQNYEK